MSDALRRCPRCGTRSRRVMCCGIDLGVKPRRWRLTNALIRHCKVVGLVRKGLTPEEYKLNLQAIGLTSTLQLTRASFDAFLKRLASLPDSPKWQPRNARAGR